MRRSSPSLRYGGRRRLILGVWLAATLVILARAASIQVLDGDFWQERAQAQQEKTQEVLPARGAILDRNGNPLAASNEVYEVAVAPWELRAENRGEIISFLASTLELSRSTVRRFSDPDVKWVPIRNTYSPRIRGALDTIPGVYLTRGWKRYRPYESMALGVLGGLQEGVGRGGIEQAFHDHLSGDPGQEIFGRDSGGKPIPGQTLLVTPPTPGGDVVLTLDLDLQQIGQEALSQAIEETGARGGDLVVMDPKTGELLALVSQMEGTQAALSAINAPYEPGSTLKPFTVAGILLHSVANLSDTVDGEQGRWLAGGRTLTDVHPYGLMTLADALRVSSNVGVAKMAQGLTPAQQYENLRDFGFGTYTGIELPGEAEGSLPRPERWSRPSPSRLAIGYEIGVTPIQMSMAYGALANGGKLMEPVLVKELRDPQGRTIYRSEPKIVRQVIPTDVAGEVSRVLADVVEDGTGTQAQLATYRVAGKSGTSRAYGPTGYGSGHYASFVSFFPVENPQLVIFVKLDRPEGAYYGGSTAAPVTRATMEAVLAAHQAPIDWGAMASLDRRQPRSSPPSGAQFAANTPSPSPSVRTPRIANEPETGVAVPDVSGFSPRLAVRRLHAAGLHVVMETPGSVTGTRPSAGSAVQPGDTVRILTKAGGR